MPDRPSPTVAAADSPPPIDLQQLERTPLRAVDPRRRGRAFGVDYVKLDMPDGAELWITVYGWELLHNLLPGVWYHDRRYVKHGEKLAGGTGSVYRVPTVGLNGHRKDLVVKFSRFAQEVPLFIASSGHTFVPEEMVDTARFNSPFEEFGVIKAMRKENVGPGALHIRTKRPLAIYCPPRTYPLWQLGRSRGRYRVPHQHLEHDQAKHDLPHKARLHLDREYILLFEWVEGHDAEWFFERGLLAGWELEALTRRVAAELRHAGYIVLDHKPKHFVLRERKDTGRLLRRHNRLVYALIDFELLLPLPPQHHVCGLDEFDFGSGI